MMACKINSVTPGRRLTVNLFHLPGWGSKTQNTSILPTLTTFLGPNHKLYPDSPCFLVWKTLLSRAERDHGIYPTELIGAVITSSLDLKSDEFFIRLLT